MSKINMIAQNLQSLAAQASGNKPEVKQNNDLANFGTVLANHINDVNTVKIESSNLQESYALGDDSVTLPQVMIASEKAAVQTSFVVAVRDRALNAYNEIMNMTL